MEENEKVILQIIENDKGQVRIKADGMDMLQVILLLNEVNAQIGKDFMAAFKEEQVEPIEATDPAEEGGVV